MTTALHDIEELERQLQSAAAENAQLRAELATARDRQSASAEILRTIAASPSDARPVFAAVASSAKRLLGGFSATVLQFIGDELHLVAFTPTGPEADAGLKASFPRKIADFPTFALVREGETIQFPDSEAADVPEPNRELARLRGFRSVLFMPLMNRGAPVGMISVTRAVTGAFPPDLVELLQTFADQAVIAIENARLFNETKEALERQTATADILKVMAASPSDVQPVFEAIATNANRLIGGFSTAVLRYIDGAAHLAAFTPTDPAGDRVLQASFPVPFAQFPPYQLVANGAAAQLPDTELEPAARDIARARGFRSMLFAPLMSEGEAIGVIIATRRAIGHFAEHHVRLLQTFADQAVIAIKNVSLFNEVRARTRDLEESLQQQTATADVLKVISRSTFDLQTVLETLIKSAVQLSGTNRGSIFLREGDVFPLKAASSTTPEFLQYWAANPPKACRGSATSRVISSGKIEVIPDVLDDPEMQMTASSLVSIRAALGVPLLRDDKVEGVLVLTRPEPGPFTKSQIDLVQTFADQAVIAVENVRLFEEAQARTRELARSLDDLRAAQDRLIQTEKLASLGQLTAGIAHEIKNPLNFVNNFASLSAELTDELNEVLAPVSLPQNVRSEVDELTGLLKDNLGKVVQHGRRADSIVKNMLLHSREGGGEHGLSDINALVEESLNLAYHGARAEKPGFNVTLKRELDPAAGHAEVFAQEISRVLLNLISNGFHAITKRKADGAAGYEPTLTAATRDRGDEIEITIRDNGTGIAGDVKEKMFNPFFTTKPAGEGTGLGLSMTHDIVVKQHGGTIDVATELGAFTEFTIRLPRKSSLPDAGR